MSYAKTSVATAEYERKKFIQKLRDEKIAGLESMIAAVRNGLHDEELLAFVGDMPVPYVEIKQDMPPAKAAVPVVPVASITSVAAAAAAAAICNDDAVYDDFFGSGAAADLDVANDSHSKRNKYYGVTQYSYANKTIGFRASINILRISSEDGKKIKSVRTIGRFNNAEDAARAYDAAAREEIASGSPRKYKFNFQE